MQAPLDAIIIGAGPAGSAAAILLARAGWSVALVERQRFPRRKVCGECLAASNLPLLDLLGIGPAFQAVAGPDLRQVALLRGQRQVLAELPGAAQEAQRWGRALGRETLDTLLLDQARAAGAQVLQPWSVQAVRGGRGDWALELREMDTGALLTLCAPVAIAAQGSWEVLPWERPQDRPREVDEPVPDRRPTSAHDRPRRQRRGAADLFAFKANFHHAAQAESLLSVLALDGGYGGMVLADGGITTVACCVRRDRLAACRRDEPGLRAGDAVEAWLMRSCAGVRKALTPAQRDGPWLAVGPLDPGIRVSAGDAMFRIGNAAGEAHPIVGEGMSMALQSAWLLCAHLLGPQTADATGAGTLFSAEAAAVPQATIHSEAWQRAMALRYATAWRRQFAPRLRLAATFAHAAMRPTASAPLITLVRAWPGLLTRGASWSGKTRGIASPTALALPRQGRATAMPAPTPAGPSSRDQATSNPRKELP
ncbi:MAG: NAD(P)-binding protein [Burkholderiales bacterium]|jgi:flavin-dependent dehydrogenase|nr:NAD(P)-binding protein [Burkholderiales bacterium]